MYRKLLFLAGFVCLSLCLGQKPDERVSFVTKPLSFERNLGQTDASARFQARSSGYNLKLDSTGVRFEFDSEGVRVEFENSDPKATLVGESSLPGKANYFPTGDPKTWIRNVPTYSRVHYGHIYPGVDVSFYGTANRLEYDFLIKPGAEPNRARMNISGSNNPFINDAGDLVLPKSSGEIRFLRPVAYQMSRDGKSRDLVDASYQLTQQGGGTEVSIALGRYDHKRELVIDPVVNALSYSEILAQSGGSAISVAADNAGNSYVLSACPSNCVGFVVNKFNSAGTLVYSSNFGTGNAVSPAQIAVDTNGQAYVVGSFNATNSSVPVTASGFQSVQGAAIYQAFLSVISADGSSLVYGTYLAGNDGLLPNYFSYASGVAVDSTGKVYMAGETYSPNWPTTPGAYETTNPNGYEMGYVAKFDPTKSGAASLLYSTLLGTLGDGGLGGIAVDSSGNAYISASGTSTYPVTPGAFAYAGADAASGGAYVTKLNATGSALVYSAYLGYGSAYGIAVEGQQNPSAYVTGTVGYPDFPTTPDAYQVQNASGFAVKMSADGSSEVYSTFLSGPTGQSGTGIAAGGTIALPMGCASLCNAYIGGLTTTGDIQAINAIQAAPNPFNQSAYIVELAADGKSALFSTYLGGVAAAVENTPSISLDASGNILLAGDLDATAAYPDFPVTISTPSSYSYSFLAKITQSANAGLLAAQRNPVNFGNQPVNVSTANYGGTISLPLSNAGSAPVTVSSIAVSPSAVFSQSNDCGTSMPAGGYCTLSLNFTPNSAVTRAGSVTVISDASNSPTVIPLTGTGYDSAFAQTSQSSLNFGSQALGTAGSQTVTVTNTGDESAGLTLTNSTADFSFLANCPSQLLPGTSCSVSVTFSPLQPGLRTDTLMIAYSNGPAAAVSLSGTGTVTGVTSSLTLSTTALAFPPQTVSTTSNNTQYVVVTNTGSIPVVLTSVVASGDFTISYIGCGESLYSLPYELNPQFGCVAQITFAPTATGTRTGALTVNSSASGSPQSVELSGTGVASSQGVEFYPSSSVSFPDTPQGTASGIQTIYFYNTGSAAITIDRVVAGGDFAIAANGTSCEGTTVPGTTPDGTGNTRSCLVEVQFIPSATGSRSGTLTFYDNAPGSPHVVNLSGNGVTATGAVALNETDISFGTLAQGVTGSSQDIYVEDLGNSSVTVNSATFSGAAASDYSVASSNCGGSSQFTLKPGQTNCYLAIQFTPMGTGTRTATLTISSSAGSQTATLTGTGVAATQAVGLTPTSLNFGGTVRGGNQPVYVRNTGTEAVTFTQNPTLSGPNSGDFSVDPDECGESDYGFVLAANSQCVIDVSFTPSVYGPESATVTFTDSAGTQTMALSGTGLSAYPAVFLDTYLISFGSQTPGTTGTYNALYLYNTGSSALKLGNVSFTGPFSSVPGGDTCSGQTIAAATGSCYVTVQFSPASAGYQTGTLTFNNRSGTPLSGVPSVPIAGYAPTPVYTALLSPLAANFAEAQPVGTTTSTAYAIYLNNTGNAPLQVGTISGTNFGTGTGGGSAEFTDGNSSGSFDGCSGQTVLPGKKCEVSVLFTPNTSGARTGSVTFPVTYLNNSTATFTATLTGTGLAEHNSAVLTPPTVVFLDQPVGVSSPYPASVSLNNSGTHPLIVGSLSNTNGTEFPLSDACSGQTVPAGSNCSIVVNFTPSATGARSGTVKFPITFADHTTQMLSLPVSGKGITGAGKTIVIAPSNALFGPQIQATTSVSDEIQVNNTGSAPVTFGTDSVTTNSAEFAVLNDHCAGVKLYPGDSCGMEVEFTPGASSTGTRSGVLTIADNATGGPHTVPLSGIAIPASQQILVSAASLAFGNQPAGSASAAQAIYFSNQSGTSGVTINSIAIGGANALDFQIQSNTCVTGTSLFAYCAVTIQFVPSSGASGALTATLTETDSAKPGTHTVTLTGSATVPSPAAALYPAALTFVTQNVGSTSAAQNLSVTNTGSANLTITALSSTNPTEFPIYLDSCSGTILTPGQRCVAGVEFAPSVGGTRTGSIKIADNASGSPQILSVSGVGYGIPGTTLTPSSLTFGNTNINVSSATQSTTLKNSGTDTLVIGSVSITGGNASEFTQTNSCGTTLAPAASCAITVTFKPTAAGSQSAYVTITDNANNISGSSQTVALSGIGVADPAAVLSPTTLTFSSTNVGITSAPLTATLTNNGTGPLAISSIMISGTNASDFSTTNDCGSSLAAASSCTISITFDPAAVGSRSATLTVTDNANNTSGSTQTLALTGTGVGVSAASISPSALVFSDQNVGTTSAAQLVTLSNSGTAALTITSISIGGTNASDFAETNTCSTSVAAGSSCSISVTFKPGAPGSRTGTITVTDNANNTAGSTQTVSLYGTGIGVPAAGVTPTSLTFAPTAVNSTATAQNVTISNTGTGPLTITQIVIGGINPGDFAETTTCGATLAAGSTCTIAVTFTPPAVGSFTANLHVIDNSGNTGSTQTVTLAGTGATATAGLTPSSLTFATESIGFTSTAQSLTLSNSGPVSLTIGNIALGGKDPSEFAQTNNCGTSLAAAASCAISVTFTPSAAGSQTATVVVTDNSGGVVGKTQTSTLTGTGTTSSAPTVVSLSPGFGSGTTQTFTAVYTDASGVGNVSSVRILFNAYLYGINACYAYYYPGTNDLYLENDVDGGTLGPLTPGSSSSLSNSQCTLNGSGTTVNTSGNNITVAFSLTFSSSFAGSKEVFLLATGSSVGKGWIQKGKWTIPPTPGPVAALTPSLVAFAPQALGAAGYSYMFLSNVGTAALAISSISLAGADPSEFVETNGCGTSLAAGASCNIAVGFAPSSEGSQTATLVVTDNSGGVSGTTQTAALTGTGINAAAPAPVSLSPNSGTGSGQIFAAGYTYPGGITSLSNVRILLNNSNAPLNGANACYVYYYPGTNALYLENNANNGTLGPLTPGSSSSLSNSQCTLNGSGTTVSTSGNTITVAYSVTFSSTFTGLKDVYLLAAGASLSNGWIHEGIWMVTTTPTPTAGITPSSLTFPAQTVGTTSTPQILTLSNSGSAALTIASIALVGDPIENAETNNCGTSLAAASSCTISVTFTPSYAGPAFELLVVTDNSGGVSGTTQTATLMGTGTNSSTPTVVSVSPNYGSGTTQTFTAVYSDPSGTSNLSNLRILFNSEINGANACYVYYYPQTNALYLENDANNGTLGPLTPGSSSSISNSQCTVNGSGTTVSTSGNSMTVAYSLTFSSSFTGSQNVYMLGASSNSNSGWVQEGTWTP